MDFRHNPVAQQNDELSAFANQKDTPFWLLEAARHIRSRDPVKAANEAEVFAELLSKRADRILADSLHRVHMPMP